MKREGTLNQDWRQLALRSELSRGRMARLPLNLTLEILGLGREARQKNRWKC